MNKKHDLDELKASPDELYEKYIQMLLDGIQLSDSQVSMFEYLKKGKTKPIIANISSSLIGAGGIKV